MAGLLKLRRAGRFTTKAGIQDSWLSRRAILTSMSSLLLWRTRTTPRSGRLQMRWPSVCLVTEGRGSGVTRSQTVPAAGSDFSKKACEVGHPQLFRSGLQAKPALCTRVKVAHPPREHPERAATVESHPCAKGRART